MNVFRNFTSGMALDDKILALKSEYGDGDYSTVEFTHNAKRIKLFHLKGDFLPSRVIAENNFYEAEFLKFVSFFNSDGGLVIDIGGNIGNHSVYFSAIKGWDVIAFEPVLQNALCLSINADLNQVSEKVSVIRSALGSRQGTCLLSKSIHANLGTYSRDAGNGQDSVEVPVMALDDIPEIRNSNDIPGLIKIDVEGMEYDVLLGAMNSLQQWKPVLAFECTTHKDYVAIMDLVSPSGYFPIEIMNHTATFVLLNKHNPSHMEKLTQYLTMYVNQRKELKYRIV